MSKTTPVSKILNVFLESVESIKNGMTLPDTLSPELRKEAMAVAKGQEDDISDELYDALFNSEFSADMPYGTQKARTGDPFQWIIKKLQKIGSNLKEGAGEPSEHGSSQAASMRIARKPHKQSADKTKPGVLVNNAKGEAIAEEESVIVVKATTKEDATTREQKFQANEWDKAFAYFKDKLLSLPTGGKITCFGDMDGEFVNVVATKEKEEDVA